MRVFLLNDQNGETIGVFSSMQKAVDVATSTIRSDCFEDGFTVGEVEKECRIKIKESKSGTKCTIDSAYGEYFVIGHIVH